MTVDSFREMVWVDYSRADGGALREFSTRRGSHCEFRPREAYGELCPGGGAHRELCPGGGAHRELCAGGGSTALGEED
jgi:hypothetical protein